MENMTLLKVKCKIFPEGGELNPDLEPAGSGKCLGTISALCILKTGRKSLVQRCSWRLREETALFDLVNVWGLMKPWYGWGGGRPCSHQHRGRVGGDTAAVVCHCWKTTS